MQKHCSKEETLCLYLVPEAFVLGTREIICRKAVHFQSYKNYFWTLLLLDKISMILLKIEMIYLLRECNRNRCQSHRNTLNISGVNLLRRENVDLRAINKKSIA